MRSSRLALAVFCAAGCRGGAALQSGAMVPTPEAASYHDLSDLDKMHALIAAAKAVGESRHGVQSALAVKASGLTARGAAFGGGGGGLGGGGEGGGGGVPQPAPAPQAVAMDAETDVLDAVAMGTPANGWGASSAASFAAPLGMGASLVSPSENDLMLLQKGGSHKNGEWAKAGKKLWKASRERDGSVSGLRSDMAPWQKMKKEQQRKKTWHKAADAKKLEDGAWRSRKSQARRAAHEEKAQPVHHRWTKMVAPRSKDSDPDLDAMRDLIKVAGDMGAAKDDNSYASAVNGIMDPHSRHAQEYEQDEEELSTPEEDMVPTMDPLDAIRNATAKSWEALDMMKEAYNGGVPRVYMEAGINATQKTIKALIAADELQVQLQNATDMGEEAKAQLEKANAPADQIAEQREALEALKASHNVTMSAGQQAAMMALNIVNSLQNHSDFLNADLAPPVRLRK